MLLGIDLLATQDTLYAPRLIEDEGRTLGTHVPTPIHTLLDPCPEELVELYIRVGNESEGELMLLDEAFVTPSAISADPDDLIACLTELCVSVTQATGLSGTARGIVLGIKVEDDSLAWVVTTTYLYTILV
jgi:hypothetical protein